ncbi:cytochrome c6, chloroplastic [Tanacetum coccineum]|uniref:Cytochrome c-553 n=1 Tax=Tanacetum coccineum TaxID=301880 RepID=A0ABQ5ASR2_9ASTR
MLVCTIPSCTQSSISPAAASALNKIINGKQRDAEANPKQQKQLKVIQRLVGPPLFAAFLALSPIITPPVSYGQAIETQRGASLFGRACIGCHVAGGNIIQPGATLFLKDLQRNGVDTEEEIYRITYYGKGRMPGFGELCTPRGQCTFGARLKEDEIKVLADFVKSQADQGWPNIGFSGD